MVEFRLGNQEMLLAKYYMIHYASRLYCAATLGNVHSRRELRHHHISHHFKTILQCPTYDCWSSLFMFMAHACGALLTALNTIILEL